MIGWGRGRARIQALEAASAAFATQLLTLSAQLAAEMERAAAQQSETVRLREQLSALEATIAHLDARFADQAAALEAVEADGAVIRDQRAAIAQVEADLLRIERQTTRDIDEVRRTSVALAETLLLPGKRAAGVVPDAASAPMP